MTPLAVACCALLIPVALRPSLPVTANASFVLATPKGQRGQAFGLGMSLGRGAAMILAGASQSRICSTRSAGTPIRRARDIQSVGVSTAGWRSN